MTNTTDLRAARGAARRILSLSTAVAFAFGAAAELVRADMFNFEDLPPMQSWWGPLSPNYAYHGFNLSAIHQGGSVYNSWYYINVPEAEQDPPDYSHNMNGLLWGVQSGEFALMSGPNVSTPFSSFSFSRSDGGLFAFDGAWFARVSTVEPSAGLLLRSYGYLEGTLVYTHVQEIFHGLRTFVAPPSGVAIDRLDFRTGYAISGSGSFTLDDFQFTLVPTPSAFALLGVFGLVRRRAR